MSKTTSTTFKDLQEGDVVYYTQKGERNKTQVIEIKNGKTFQFKTANGSGVKMTPTQADGKTYKSSANVLWELS